MQVKINNNTMYNNKYLKLFLVFFVPLFLVGATLLVVIITQGGQVTNNGIVNDKGILRIFTDPTNIGFTLYVDNKLTSLQNNSSVNIAAGEYDIRIETENYVPWEKKIIISQGIVNEVYAKLFSNNLALSKITTDNISRMFFSQNSEYLYYVVNDSQFPQALGIWKLPLNNNSFIFFNQNQKPTKFYDITDKKISAIVAGTYDIAPSDDGNKILLTDTKNKQYLVITNQQNLGGTSTSVLDISETIGFEPQAVKWMNNFNSLMIIQGNSIFEYNLINDVVTLIRLTTETAPIYAVNKNQTLVYDPVKKVLSTYKNQLLSGILPNTIFPENIKNIYLADDNDRFLFMQSESSWILLDLEQYTFKVLAPSEYTLLSVAPDGTSLIFRNIENNILTVNIKEDIVGNKLEVTTGSFDIKFTDIKTVKYTAQPSLLLIQSKKDNFVYAYDNDGTNKVKLLDNPTVIDNFDFDNTGSNLYVLLVDETTPQNKTTSSNIYKVTLNK